MLTDQQQIAALIAALDEQQIKDLLVALRRQRMHDAKILAAAEKALPELLRKLRGPD
jgi:hypothetical protein